MLNIYKEKYSKPFIQYITVNADGIILESDDVLLPHLTTQKISTIHPFFESILPLLQTPNQDVKFACIHLKKDLVVDISLKTFNKNEPSLLIINDLTSHYENYQATTQLRNESVINSQILELKNHYLLEKEEFKNKFIANFSHILRDPITGILTFVDFLHKTPLNSNQEDYLRIIKSSSEFLKKMIDNILDISKIEANKLELIIAPFNLLDLLNDLKATYTIKAEKKGLEFNCLFNEKLPTLLEGDALRLRQVLSNLLDNALKFTHKGSITFSASLNQIRAQKANIHFEIKDTGIGIKEEHYNTIFESFKQLNNPNNYSGSGLGLSIVKHLLSYNNSEITVTSKFGEGTTFSTNINFKTLPNTTTISKPKSTENTSLPKSKKYSLLLIESSEITQLAVLKILATQGNYFLDILTSEHQVMEKIEEQEFDLILTEVEENGIQGCQIAKQVRKLKDRDLKKTPIIGLATRVYKEDLKVYKKAGITDILKKPFNEEELLNKLKAYLK